MFNTQIKTITSRLIIILLVSVLSITVISQAISAQTNTNNATSDEARALNNKGVSLAALGRHEEAIPLYDKALAINPNDSITLNNKGLALAALGRR
jgi:tetratricopeptide (TPR) repeat protein